MEIDHFQNRDVDGRIIFKNGIQGDSVIGHGHGYSGSGEGRKNEILRYFMIQEPYI